MSTHEEDLPRFECEGRGCPSKKPEELFCLNGLGDHKTKDDKRWLCDKCFEKAHGFKPLQKPDGGDK